MSVETKYEKRRWKYEENDEAIE